MGARESLGGLDDATAVLTFRIRLTLLVNVFPLVQSELGREPMLQRIHSCELAIAHRIFENSPHA